MTSKRYIQRGENTPLLLIARSLQNTRPRHLQRLPSLRVTLCIPFILLLTISLLIFLPTARADGEAATVQITGPLQPPGFSPALVTIHANDYIIFVNQSAPAAAYSIAADNGAFSSPAIAPGKQWTAAFSNPGEYEYHATSAQQKMVGEIIVVANSVSLLPTPAPEVQATALALIQAGKTPPDNLSIPTSTPTSPSGKLPRLLPLSGSGPTSLLLMIESGMLIVAFLIGTFFLARFFWRRFRKKGDATATTTSPEQALPARKRWLRWFKKRKTEDDDDEEDDDE